MEKDKKKVYISGPITGRNEKEMKAHFLKAEGRLKALGYEVITPLTWQGNDKKWHEYMRPSIKALMDADIIYMLNGWRDSKGASLEWHIASNIEMEIFYEENEGDGF